jgi:hypothetical protein
MMPPVEDKALIYKKCSFERSGMMPPVEDKALIYKKMHLRAKRDDGLLDSTQN